MNKENILKLADIIEQTHFEADCYKEGPVKNAFNMNYLQFDCGTPACIAGWATAQSLNVEVIPPGAWVEKIGADWLGLEFNWAYNHLFYPGRHLDAIGWDDCDYSAIKPEMAARALRALAEYEEEPRESDMNFIWEKAIKA